MGSNFLTFNELPQVLEGVEMIVKRRLGVLLAGTVLGTSFLMAAPAFADDAQLQQQINAMQQQLNAMQAQLAQTKAQAAAAKQQANAAQQQATTAQQQTSIAQQNLQNIPANLYNADLPIPTKGPSFFDTIHISLAGSFLAMEGAFRQRNEASSGASDPGFGTIPLQNSPLYFQNELRFSAQQSRIALKASGDIDPTQHVKGYYESDWLGAGVTANSRESNSYNLRIRQAYFEYDNDVWGFHLVPGQQWSLLTQNRVGMLPGTENVPLTIDAQYVAGFNWARQPEIRFVKDWGQWAWFGVSVAAPQTAFASNGNGVAGSPTIGVPGVGTQTALATPNSGLTVPPGLFVNPGTNCNASGLLNSTTICSNNIAPDIIEKFALDPGWGHYEAIGLQRWFTDSVAAGVPVAAPTAFAPGASWSQKTNFGWGVGGNVLLPVWPKFVDLQGSVLYGQGIGRYSSSQLADVVIGPNGSETPIRSVQFLVGGVAHPFFGTDIYAYYGQDRTQANAWTVDGVQGGWGNAAFPESCGVLIPGSTTSEGFNGSSALCAANVKRVQELTIGFWQDIYKGDLGRARVGLQYEYVALDLFSGATGTIPSAVTGVSSAVATAGANSGLHPNNNIVFFSLRYYPFN
jgi:hypothetical protein